MDFASLMSAEISKSKSPPTQPKSTKKFLKKSELEAQRQEAYLKEQANLQRQREEKLAQKRKRDDEEALRNAERDEKRQRLAEESRIRREEEEAQAETHRRKRLGLPELPSQPQTDSSSPTSDHQQDIPPATLRLALRALSEPTHLFGETHAQRLKRYHALTTPVPNTPKKYPGPIATTLEPVPESSMKVPTTIPSDLAARTFLYRQLSSYFNLLFSAWSATLSARASSVSQTPEGQRASLTLTNCITSLQPLFKKFEQNTLEDSILRPLLQIVSAAQERRYVDANDGYLRLSIGKAAWPIGVTMVGIHERSAREKLHKGAEEGHILSDEVTRKFLQGIKRCLSFAQTRWPPEDGGQIMG
ncbi:uncharacterized protein KY384_006677 [Bacidia gigantensis]|uniref:uncharacterized protein n=1 Tax=Bacidia gigantensis TaxID=2732470 RepID=UPI001D055CBE|nr:uncharacterized protein KY384_006677 [Bacidia gigantensis]KAG8528988.1 hypothetical protein KY384_006677 [Bacidia gigantensis]